MNSEWRFFLANHICVFSIHNISVHTVITVNTLQYHMSLYKLDYYFFKFFNNLFALGSIDPKD